MKNVYSPGSGADKGSIFVFKSTKLLLIRPFAVSFSHLISL